MTHVAKAGYRVRSCCVQLVFLFNAEESYLSISNIVRLVRHVTCKALKYPFHSLLMGQGGY